MEKKDIERAQMGGGGKSTEEISGLNCARKTKEVTSKYSFSREE